MGQGRAVIVIAAAAAVFMAACSQKSQPVAAPPAAAASQVRTIDEARTLLRAGKSDEYLRALEWLSKSADAQTRRRALALRGLYLHEQKRYDEAIPLLTEAAQAYPEVAPFLRLRIVEGEAARNNLDRAAAIASEIIALDDSSAETVARLELPAIYARLGDTASTDASWNQAMQVPIDELTEGDFVDMAAALAKAGRDDLATRTRMRLLTDYTQGRYTEQLYDLVKPSLDALPLADNIALATKLSRANRYDQALDLFNRIPGGVPQARGTRLRALFNSRNYTQLLDETKDVALDDPSLILLRARAAWRAGRPDELLAGLDQVETQFPTSAQAIEAKIVRAKYYTTDVVDYAKAVENLTKAIAAGAEGSDGENLWNLGWTYTLWQKYDDALKTFDAYVRKYPDGDWKTNSLFWSAKILDRLGRAAERDAKARQIVDEFPYSYYAYRATELWPNIATLAAPTRSTPQNFPDVAAALANVTEPRFTTVRELMSIDLNRSAAREMKVLASRYSTNPGVQFMLADVYVQGGEPFKANGVLQRTFRPFVRHGGANIPQRFWEILFPLAYWPTIETEAKRRGIDPYLVASIIRQESGFEPTTVSNAGAVGLMQIMPEEAARIAADAGLGAITREDLFVPEKNIAVGAAEFSQKLTRWNGNQVLAIASYNAGERAVGTWLETTPVDDIDLFIEAIPYAETRLYVKTVTRNRFEYRRIYEGSTASQQRQNGTP